MDNHDEMREIEVTMEVLTRVDMDLAYSSEKIANLDKLLMHVMTCENDLEEMSLENDKDSVYLFQKLFVFDFLSNFLVSEVRELDIFMGSLQEVITNACSNISIFRDLTDMFEMMEAKLHDSEDLLKQLREQLLEIGLQSTKFTKASLDFEQNDCSYDMVTCLSKKAYPRMHMVEQKRYILKMLEKSLDRELNLEKKLSEFKQNEEDLKLKQCLTEQVAFSMEEAAEAVWRRFLEAENTKEVLMGTSKEMLKRFQITEFDLNCSMRREDEAKRKLINCTEQLKARDNALQKVENSISELISNNLEVCSLREKVEMLEKQIEESDALLKNAHTLIQEHEDNILEMENVIESLKENIDLADNRADGAQAKVTELTETNSELNDELSFLKSTNDNNVKKVNTIEKQLRDMEIQLQYARASSEASQEQQNMLYSAIWDMETLVEELKSKVSKAENEEEQCILLSETKIELDKEVKFLRSKVKSLEMCLKQAKGENLASAKDVNVKTRIIMDMVVQLGLERERIRKQLFGLVEENKVLVERVKKLEGGASVSDKYGGTENGAFFSLENDIREATARSFKQVDESSIDNDVCGTEPGSSNSPGVNSKIVSEEDSGTTTKAEGPDVHNYIYVYIPIIVLLFSILSLYFFNKITNI